MFSIVLLRLVRQEVQRLASVVTFNVWHKTVEAVELNGYVIPRGTLIAPQMSVLFQDETEFDQPEKVNGDEQLGRMSCSSLIRPVSWIRFEARLSNRRLSHSELENDHALGKAWHVQNCS